MSVISETAAAQAPIVGLEFDEPAEAIVAKPAELAIQCVLTVGNLLTAKQMKSPNYRLGGRLYPWPDFYTVPNGIVPRCFITRLKKDAYRSVHKSQVPEKEWAMWVDSFTLKNQWDPATQSYHDVTVGLDGYSKDLLYKPIRPIHEIGRIAGRGEGVVALDADCGINSGADIKEAQFHYFPNWLEILAQKEGHKIPDRLRELEDHLRNRREQTNSPQLRAIGDAFLYSCVEFKDFAKAARLDVQTAAIKETEKTGGARYDEVAERLFRELEFTREDQLHENMARDANAQQSSSAQIATAIDLLAKVVAGQQKAEAALPPAESQPPAPTTLEEAAAEVERAHNSEYNEGHENTPLQQLRSEEREPVGRVLPEVQSGEDATISQRGPDGRDGGAVDKNQGSAQGGSVQSTGEDRSTAVREVPEPKVSDAPRGLQQAAGGEVAVPPLPHGGTPAASEPSEDPAGSDLANSTEDIEPGFTDMSAEVADDTEAQAIVAQYLGEPEEEVKE